MSIRMHRLSTVNRDDDDDDDDDEDDDDDDDDDDEVPKIRVLHFF